MGAKTVIAIPEYGGFRDYAQIAVNLAYLHKKQVNKHD
jgi:hypothetical protein